ncbi:MAG: hypothetical protein GY856_27340 [bacterium]|nr:hypothetical protein [bacterium]
MSTAAAFATRPCVTCSWGDTGPELALLRLLGLFDRPMTETQLRALLGEADIAQGLPAPPSRRFERLIDRLGRAGLVVRRLDSYDTHPLIRAWFAVRLQETRPEELRQAHRVLFRHFCRIPQEHQPSTLAGLEPLYRAVYHGCEGGLAGEALEVFRRRIHRNGESYSTCQLGAYTSDLFALSCLFPQGWAEPPREPLEAGDRNDLLDQVAHCFLSLTRMNEAVAALEANLAVTRELGERFSLVVIYRQLVEALISCGRLDEALLAATRELDLLRAGDSPTEQVLALADRGYALYHLGRLAEASHAFAEAEALADPTERPLGGYAGFQMCELLLARDEWRQALDRAQRGLTACAEGDAWILHRALFTLIRGQALMRGDRRDQGLADLEDAVGLARQSGADESLAHVLTNAAGEYLHVGFHERCRSRLDEASIFVDPGSMRLLAIDVALVRGELALATGDVATARTACDYATAEIAATGYRLKRLALDKLKGSLVGR